MWLLPPEAVKNQKRSAKIDCVWNFCNQLEHNNWMARGKEGYTSACIWERSCKNSLESTAFGYQLTTDHDRVREVLRFCLPRAKLTLSVCMCERSLVQLRGRTYYTSVKACALTCLILQKADTLTAAAAT